jgi:hypothetical protein
MPKSKIVITIMYISTGKPIGWWMESCFQLTERSDIAITWHPLFFSLNPFCHLEPNLVGIFTRWSPSQVIGWSEVQKINKSSKGVEKDVSIYIYMSQTNSTMYPCR